MMPVNLRLSGIILLTVALTACGFQLRGTRSGAIAPAYQAMRVDEGGLKGSLVSSMLQNALVERAGVSLSDKKNAASLKLKSELMERRVLSVNPLTGTATDYVLVYRLTYQLDGADGKAVIPPQAVYAQQDFRYDSRDALGMSRQEEALQEQLRATVVDQVIARLIHLRTEP